MSGFSGDSRAAWEQELGSIGVWNGSVGLEAPGSISDGVKLIWRYARIHELASDTFCASELDTVD